jgi:hypothetical protein
MNDAGRESARYGLGVTPVFDCLSECWTILRVP